MFEILDFANAIKKEMEERKNNRMIRLDICHLSYLYNELVLSAQSFSNEITKNEKCGMEEIELTKKSKSELIHIAVCAMWLWIRG